MCTWRPEPDVWGSGFAMKLATWPRRRATAFNARFISTASSQAASASGTWWRFASNWPSPNSVKTEVSGIDCAAQARFASSMMSR